jgi:hypothetical protein
MILGSYVGDLSGSHVFPKGSKAPEMRSEIAVFLERGGGREIWRRCLYMAYESRNRPSLFKLNFYTIVFSKVGNH